jgi:hypothetical protein
MEHRRRSFEAGGIHSHASLSSTTTCRPLASVVDALSGHPRGSEGVSMQDPASELPRTYILGTWPVALVIP